MHSNFKNKSLHIFLNLYKKIEKPFCFHGQFEIQGYKLRKKGAFHRVINFDHDKFFILKKNPDNHSVALT